MEIDKYGYEGCEISILFLLNGSTIDAWFSTHRYRPHCTAWWEVAPRIWNRRRQSSHGLNIDDYKVNELQTELINVGLLL